MAGEEGVRSPARLFVSCLTGAKWRARQTPLSGERCARIARTRPLRGASTIERTRRRPPLRRWLVSTVSSGRLPKGTPIGRTGEPLKSQLVPQGVRDRVTSLLETADVCLEGLEEHSAGSPVPRSSAQVSLVHEGCASSQHRAPQTRRSDGRPWRPAAASTDFQSGVAPTCHNLSTGWKVSPCGGAACGVSSTVSTEGASGR